MSKSLCSLNRGYELPPKVATNFSPNDILLVQFLFALEQWKILQVLIFGEELTKFIEHVAVAEKVLSVFRTVVIEGFLNLYKHHAQPLFELLRHPRWSNTVEEVRDVRCVFVVLVIFQLFQKSTNLGVCDIAHLFDFHLFQLGAQLLNELVWNGGALLCLEL